MKFTLIYVGLWILLMLGVRWFFKWVEDTEYPEDECLNCDLSDEGNLCEDCKGGESCGGNFGMRPG